MDRRRMEELWEAAEPPSGFAERVVSRALEESRPKPAPTRSRKGQAAAVIGLVLAAAAAFVLWLRADGFVGKGEKLASERTELALGRRAIAVLEPQAEIRWDGPRVEQPRGEVFYRVEPGSHFVVNTPVGEVAVMGTCFRVRVAPARDPQGSTGMEKNVKVAAASAALGALVVVTVYEGRVRLSHAKEKIELGAGESGRLDATGARQLDTDELAQAESALSDAKAESSLGRANDNLAADVADLGRKLRNIEKEKSKLEAQLETAKTELARRTDAGAPRSRHEFDLDESDWKDLAVDGTIKFRVPCAKPNGWVPEADQLDQLGLAPDDTEAIRAAYQRSYERMWKTLKPLCVKAVGSEHVADILGPDTCTHVVVDVARREDGAAVREAQRLVAEVRAGLKPAPAPGAPQNPVYEVFAMLTGELGRFEADLGQSFGPEEAKRLAYSKQMCAGHSTFGGPGPREPKK